MLENFHFLRPLVLLGLVPLALLLYYLKSMRDDSSPWRRLIDTNLQPLLLDGADDTKKRRFLWLIGLGWFVAVLALANPTWQQIPRPLLQSAMSRVVVLDLSRSMYAADVKPSRIAQARFKVDDILKYDNEGQTGLVVFAGDAFTVAPLTRDTETLSSLLMSLSPNIMPVQGSRLELGLKKAAEILIQAGINRAEIIALTDGYSNSDVLRVASKLNADGFRISIIGIGTSEGGPIADSSGQYLRDDDRNVVISKLDADQLRDVANAGGGAYLALSTDGSDIDAILSDKPDTEDGSSDVLDEGLTSAHWDETGPWIALLLLPLAALAFRRGWLINVVLVTLIAGVQPRPVQAGWWTDLWLRRDQQAAQAMQVKDYEQVRQLSNDPLMLGGADYRESNYESAASTFETDSRADAVYNLGNSLARLDQLEEAADAYREALRLEPDMEDAKANLKAVLEALEKREQQQESGDGEDQESGENEGESSGESSGEGQSSDQSESEGESGDESAAEGDSGDESESGENQQDPSDSFADAAESLEEGQNEDENDNTQPLEADARDGESGDEQDAQQVSESGEPAQAEELSTEEQLAAEQWLRRIPDDPGGLLRRKFRYQYHRRTPPPDHSRQTW